MEYDSRVADALIIIGVLILALALAFADSYVTLLIGGWLGVMWGIVIGIPVMVFVCESFATFLVYLLSR